MVEIDRLTVIISHTLSLVLDKSRDSIVIRVTKVSNNNTRYMFLVDDKVVLSVVFDVHTSVIKLLRMCLEDGYISSPKDFLWLLVRTYLLITKLDCVPEEFLNLVNFSDVVTLVKSRKFSIASKREYEVEGNICILKSKDAVSILQSLTKGACLGNQ